MTKHHAILLCDAGGHLGINKKGKTINRVSDWP